MFSFGICRMVGECFDVSNEPLASIYRVTWMRPFSFTLIYPLLILLRKGESIMSCTYTQSLFSSFYTTLLTQSMKQSPSWEAILSQINPVHIPHPTSWRPILILLYRLRLSLSNGLFPSCFLTKNPVCTPPLMWNIIRVIKSSRMRRAGHVAHIGWHHHLPLMLHTLSLIT